MTPHSRGTCQADLAGDRHDTNQTPNGRLLSALTNMKNLGFCLFDFQLSEDKGRTSLPPEAKLALI